MTTNSLLADKVSSARGVQVNNSETAVGNTGTLTAKEIRVSVCVSARVEVYLLTLPSERA